MSLTALQKDLKMKLQLTKKQAIKAHKAASRRVALELGISTPTHKVHKNKKAYNRKLKHKATI